MTLLKKLDVVLKCLEKHHSERHHTLISIQEILDKENPEVKWGETFFILNKIAMDGFIDTKELPIPDTASKEIYYNINFEGRVFNEQGGYTNRRNQDRLTKVNQIFLVVLTFLIAVGTLVAGWYYVIEIWKSYHHC